MIRGYAPALRSYNAYMRRLAFIATFVLALNVPPVWAQMRSGPRVMGPPVRSGFAVRRPVFVGGGLAFGHNPRFNVFFTSNPFFFQRRFFRSSFFFTQPFFVPVVYGGYPYPVISQSYTANDSAAAYDQQRELVREVDRLTEEVERLRDEQANRQSPPPPPQLQAQNTEPLRPTVLVFRDKHIAEVKNYAIVGPTLWIFSERRARKIPLAELDVPATSKLNDERGVEFRLPAH